jgi:thiol-disulfide isomerase/thioredoxin
MKTLGSIVFSVLFTVLVTTSVSAQADLAALDGSTVNVKGQTGKVVILAIGASWLPLSVKQVSFANSLAKKYAGKDVVVYFVATDSMNPRSKNFASNEQVKQFGDVNKLNVRILRDSDGTAMTKNFGVEQFPSFVILDKRGQRFGEPFGGIDPKFDVTVPISKAVDSLLRQ